MKGPKGGGLHEADEPRASVCSVESPPIRIIKVGGGVRQGGGDICGRDEEHHFAEISRYIVFLPLLARV